VIELPTPLYKKWAVSRFGCGTLYILLQGADVDVHLDVLAQEQGLERGILLWLQT
jgi:hypothetical protein